MKKHLQKYFRYLLLVSVISCSCCMMSIVAFGMVYDDGFEVRTTDKNFKISNPVYSLSTGGPLISLEPSKEVTVTLKAKKTDGEIQSITAVTAVYNADNIIEKACYTTTVLNGTDEKDIVLHLLLPPTVKNGWYLKTYIMDNLKENGLWSFNESFRYPPIKVFDTAWNTSKNWSMTSDEKYEGYSSLKSTGSASGDVCWQQFDIGKNASYVLRFMAKGDSLFNYSVTDENNKMLGVNAKFNGSNDWKSSYYLFETLTNKAKICFSDTNPSGISYIDNIKISTNLLKNGGFEKTYADTTRGGILEPSEWTLRETNYDSGGKIIINNQAASGNCSVSIKSSGAGRVYIFQNVTFAHSGTYKVTAKMKRVSDDSAFKPYICFYNMSTTLVDNRTINQISNTDFDEVSAVFNLDSIPDKGASIILGILEGAGEVLIDDVIFEEVTNDSANISTDDSSGNNGSVNNTATLLDPITVNPDTQVASISGSAGKEYANKRVACIALQKGININQLENVSDNNISQLIYGIDETYADANGKFTINFKMDGPSGLYNVLVGSIVNGKTHDSVFKYFNPNDVKTLLSTIEGARKEKNAVLIKSTLSETLSRETLGIEFDLYGDLTFDKLDESVFTTLAQYSGVYATATDLVNQYKKAVAINAFDSIQDKDKVESLIGECDEVINIKSANPYLLYNDFSTESKDFVNTAITSANFTELQQIKDFFNEKVLLRTVYTMPNWSDFKPLINSNNEYFKISLEEYNALESPSEVDKELAGKPYADFVALRTAFYQAVHNQQEIEDDQKSPKKGSGNGGGGPKVTKVIQSVPDLPIPKNDETVRFDDLSSVPWAEKAINTLAERNIVLGKEKNKYAPNDNVTREEAIKMLIAAFGLLDESSEATFSDINKEQWSYKYISSAQKLGIANGKTDNTFCPENVVSRQEFAVLAYRIAAYKGIEFPLIKGETKFSDANEIEEYAKESIVIMQKANIINGMEDGTFAPNGYCTRAQVAKIIFELLIIAEK